jgi:hypothetical protein
MKSLFAVIIFSMLSFSSISQVYHPVLELNKYWDQSDEDGYSPCSFDPRRYLFIQKDSIINGHNYQLCKSYYLHGIPGPGTMTCPPFVVDTNYSIDYWLREDTIARKVYIYDYFGVPTTDQLLYDFTLEVGDTLKSYYACWGCQGYPLILSAIEIVTLHNGETRKKYIFNEVYYQTFYIEGIGGGLGFVYPLYFFEHQDRMLYCVKNDGEDIWGTECNTVFVGVKNEPEISISVFPNPADYVLNINLSNVSESHPFSFEVFDLKGTKILTTKLESSDNAVSLTNLSPGFYLYKIRSEATLKNGKLVKL